MRLRRITVQAFRNMELADLSFDGRQQFLLGANGQGKTNLLEAVAYISALRSFRTHDAKVLIRQGCEEAAIAAEFEHEQRGESKVLIRLRAGNRELSCDGERITRLGDHLGHFPTVVFSSQDQQLVRGAPALRRHWLDMTLSAVSPDYLRDLQTYHRALAGRNKLIKDPRPSAEALAAFEHPLAEAAASLAERRTTGVGALSRHMSAAYARIANEADTADLQFEPDTRIDGTAAWRTFFERNRARDLPARTTTAGPHRDDLALLVGGRAAREYGSEGQQRSLALALRLAQVAFFREHRGIEPILLADDVLGELDPERRRHFWASLGSERQIIATGTRLPEANLGEWQVFHVSAGKFTNA